MNSFWTRFLSIFGTGAVTVAATVAASPTATWSDLTTPHGVAQVILTMAGVGAAGFIPSPAGKSPSAPAGK